MNPFKRDTPTVPGSTSSPSGGLSHQETIISADATFKGDMNFDGSLRVEGRFEGKINARGKLTVTSTARILGEATVAAAQIEGVFKGNIAATDRVDLGSTAQVEGDIRTARLTVAEGATLAGRCIIGREGAKSAPPSAKGDGGLEELPTA